MMTIEQYIAVMFAVIITVAMVVMAIEQITAFKRIKARLNKAENYARAAAPYVRAYELSKRHKLFRQNAYQTQEIGRVSK